MNLYIFPFLLLFELSSHTCFGHLTVQEIQDIENEAKIYVEGLNKQTAALSNKLTLKIWEYETNITDYNRNQMIAASFELTAFMKEQWKKTATYPWKQFKKCKLKREFKKYTQLGFEALPEEKYKRYQEVVHQMMKIHRETKCPSFDNREILKSLEPDLMNIFAESRDPAELAHYWLKWRELVGRPCKSLFEEYVMLSNEAATLNGFQSCDELWIDDFQSPNNTVFKGRMEYLWRQIRPFYIELYSYVRYKLRIFYTKFAIPKKRPTPAHMLGDLWARSWTNIFDIAVPYPNKSRIDVTEEMVKQGYTPLKMFKTAEKFYKSIGFKALPRSFWTKSLFEKPNDREMNCQASALDFSNGRDYRIKMCTRVNMEDFLKAHNEMSNIYYSIQYKEQPHSLRRGPHPSFRQAVADAIVLSVATPKHMRKIGLVKGKGNDDDDDVEAEINYLFYMALEKIPLIPYAYIMDIYRWNIFRGETNPMLLNNDWWKLRREYQGVSPPFIRTEADFDAAADHHTVSGTPYISHFLSSILQFQFYRNLCSHDEYDVTKPMKKPLFKCDIFKSKKAGADLIDMMRRGASWTFKDTMFLFTGRRRADTGALLEYFAPLYGWLRDYNIRNNVYRGWELHFNSPK